MPYIEIPSEAIHDLEAFVRIPVGMEKIVCVPTHEAEDHLHQATFADRWFTEALMQAFKYGRLPSRDFLVNAAARDLVFAKSDSSPGGPAGDAE
jgi:hypothetical protein